MTPRLPSLEQIEQTAEFQQTVRARPILDLYVTREMDDGRLAYCVPFAGQTLAMTRDNFQSMLADQYETYYGAKRDRPRTFAVFGGFILLIMLLLPLLWTWYGIAIVAWVFRSGFRRTNPVQGDVYRERYDAEVLPYSLVPAWDYYCKTLLARYATRPLGFKWVMNDLGLIATSAFMFTVGYMVFPTLVGHGLGETLWAINTFQAGDLLWRIYTQPMLYLLAILASGFVFGIATLFFSYGLYWTFRLQHGRGPEPRDFTAHLKTQIFPLRAPANARRPA